MASPTSCFQCFQDTFPATPVVPPTGLFMPISVRGICKAKWPTVNSLQLLIDLFLHACSKNILARSIVNLSTVLQLLFKLVAHAAGTYLQGLMILQCSNPKIDRTVGTQLENVGNLEIMMEKQWKGGKIIQVVHRTCRSWATGGELLDPRGPFPRCRAAW